MISPLQAHLSETLTSLKFATKVRAVVWAPCHCLGSLLCPTANCVRRSTIPISVQLKDKQRSETRDISGCCYTDRQQRFQAMYWNSGSWLWDSANFVGLQKRGQIHGDNAGVTHPKILYPDRGCVASITYLNLPCTTRELINSCCSCSLLFSAIVTALPRVSLASCTVQQSFTDYVLSSAFLVDCNFSNLLKHAYFCATGVEIQVAWETFFVCKTDKAFSRTSLSLPRTHL